MPRLDQRLKIVARQIRSEVHADIGSDHGHLLLALLAAGRISRGIAIENKLQPFANSKATLVGRNCDVRMGDGLEALILGEANSLSICGMGGGSIVQILTRFPERVPSKLIVQPNQRVDLVRRWGLKTGFRLVDEHFVGDDRIFEVLEFASDAVEASSNEDSAGTDPAFRDPAYRGLDEDAAVILGPHHLVRREPKFIERLQEERAYYLGMQALSPASRKRFEAISRVLEG